MPNFKPVKGFEDEYLISDTGIVKCIRKSRRKDYIDPVGAARGHALRVTLHHAGHSNRCYRLDRLVAEHFVPNPHKYKYLHNISGDKNDVSASNLEFREYPPTRSKYTKPEIAEIAKNYLDNTDVPFTTYAKQFGLSSNMLRHYVIEWAKDNDRMEDYEERMYVNRANCIGTARTHIIKPVIQYNLNGTMLKTYPSLIAAAVAVGIDSSNLSRNVNSTTLTKVGGYKWKFK